MKKIHYIHALFLLIGITGCEKAVEVDIPMGKFTNNAVYNTDDLAQAGIRGIYATMVNPTTTAPFQGAISGNFGILSDELVRTTYSDAQRILLENNLAPTAGLTESLWAVFYNYILQANMVYENAEVSQGLSPSVRQSIMGEARLLRALGLFYLANIYGDVPLTLTGDYTKNTLLPVSSQEEVFKQVVSDLIYARENLIGNSTVAGSRYRPTKWSAVALLARVYLYQKNWAAAEQAATDVIALNTIYSLEELDNVFLPTSKEAIWALNNAGSNLYTGQAGSVQGTVAANSQFQLSSYTLSKFEPADQRKIKWTRTLGTTTTTTAPYKFKTFGNAQVGAKAESVMLVRLAELYLIRAEARAMQNKLAPAISDIDALRVRAGAVANNDGANAGNRFKTIAFNNPGIGKEDLIKVIYDERLRELFSELGHRWFDAKRATNDLETFFEGRKPGIAPTDAFFPIPERELQYNPNISQREGY